MCVTCNSSLVHATDCTALHDQHTGHLTAVCHTHFRQTEGHAKPECVCVRERVCDVVRLDVSVRACV